MNLVKVAAEREYCVFFTNDWALKLREQIGDRRAVIIAPAPIAEQLAQSWSDLPILPMADGEAQKSPESLVKAWEELAKLNLDRSGLIIGIGGGATTDLAGFLAATYLRGLNWVAVPTTVAGMVDAAIGGKTGLNLLAGKNLVGAFHSPEAVIIDTTWARTLSNRDLSAGLAEAVKCGFIADPEILRAFQAQTLPLDEIIRRAVTVKATVVSKDFRESFEREALNYGHTLGHAIERHSGFQLRHGEAISIGMVFAAQLSVEYAGLAESTFNLHEELLVQLGLPITYQAEAWDELYLLMQNDKKRSGGKIRFVTLADLGHTDRYATSDEKALRDIYLRSVAG